MNTRIRLAILACMLLVLGSGMEAASPTYIKTAFYKFSGKLIEMGVVTSSKVDKHDNWHFIKYEFSLPKSQIQLVQNFETKEMKRNVAYAYKSLFRQAGTGGPVEYIGYGENNKQSYTLGSYKNRNYDILYIRDGNDKSKRYVYALVWYEEHKNICGTLIEFYGLDPVIQRKQNSGFGSQGMQGLSKLATDTIQIVGNWIGRNSNGLTYLGDNYNNSGEVLSAIASISATYNLLDTQIGEKVAKTKKENMQYKLVLANRLVSICSVYGRKLLSKNDRMASLQILNDMKRSEPDVVANTLLGTAITLLDY